MLSFYFYVRKFDRKLDQNDNQILISTNGRNDAIIVSSGANAQPDERHANYRIVLCVGTVRQSQ